MRVTVRSVDSEAEIRQAPRRGGADDAGLEVVRADLTSDDGFLTATASVEEVHHVASPIPPAQPEDPDDLILPVREGAVRVLGAAREPGARHVVLTLSFAAVDYSPKPVRDYTEADWTDPDTPGLPPYPRSKAIAERAAWNYVEQYPSDTELVVVNPTFIIGPSLVDSLRSSLVAIKAIAEGTMAALPHQRFDLADVRLQADAHLKAAAATTSAPPARTSGFSRKAVAGAWRPGGDCGQCGIGTDASGGSRRTGLDNSSGMNWLFRSARCLSARKAAASGGRVPGCAGPRFPYPRLRRTAFRFPRPLKCNPPTARLKSSNEDNLRAWEEFMRTTIALDDDLLAEAQRLTGTSEKSALVRQALRALIERESARRLARLGGSERELTAPPRRRPEPR